MDEEQWQAVRSEFRLTPREFQVAKLLFGGLTRVEVASRIGTKLSTVRHHMQSIYSKMQVRNRVGIALRVISVRDRH